MNITCEEHELLIELAVKDITRLRAIIDEQDKMVNNTDHYCWVLQDVLVNAKIPLAQVIALSQESQYFEGTSQFIQTITEHYGEHDENSMETILTN